MIVIRWHPTVISDTSDFVTPHGSRVFIHHEARFDGERTIIVDVGKSDIQEKINSYAPFCDINYMLHRLSIGDRSFINPRQPMYGDFSGMPTAPHDILNIARSAELRFSQLDAEEKKEFNNDYRVWLSRCMRDGVRPQSQLDSVVSDSSTGSTEVKE